MVHGLDLDASGRITGVVYRQGGADYRQRCANVFLCAGGAETPRLLLNLGIANSSGQIGRNFMAHIATQVWGRFDAVMRMNRGYPSSLITEDFVRPAGASFAGGYLVQSLGVLPITLATSLARRGGLWGDKLPEVLDSYNQLASIGINGECLPSADNRLTLANEVDEVGLRRASIDFSYGDNEKALDKHATATMTAVWEAAGAKSIFSLPRSAHTIRTCRMSENGDDGVVDPNGKSFDIENLFVCDNSIFSASLCANPALTIMTIALRTANQFLSQADEPRFSRARHRRPNAALSIPIYRGSGA